MITYILLLVGCVVIFKLLSADMCLSSRGRFWCGLISFLAASLMVLFINALSQDLVKQESYREDMRFSILSLNNKHAVGGEFTLGTGNINTREYYLTFYKVGNRINRFKILVEEASLIQTSDLPPHVSYQKIYYKYPAWMLYPSPTITEYSKYDIIVPVNTVIESFRVE